MSQSFKVGIVGATGAVGRLLLQLLIEREFPIKSLHLLASERSVGKTLDYLDQQLVVQNVAEFDFSNCDICFFSAGKTVSEHYAPLAVEAGCCVIDNTSAFRYQDDVPLVVPEVNAGVLSSCDKPCIISNPNCSTIQMLVALNPIYQVVGIKRIIVSTYQAVSGAGQQAINRLISEQKTVNSHDTPQIANNVIPHIDVIQDNSYTREEMKMCWETQKIWQNTQIIVDATAVRVPVINGHSEAITIETIAPLKCDHAIRLINAGKGVKYQINQPVTPRDISGKDDIYVSRIRQSLAFGQNGLSLWVVGDNLRKGAATNSIQIAEKWLISQ